MSLVTRSLFQRFPNNVLFQRYTARSSYILAKYAEAQTLLLDIRDKCDKGQRGYTDFAKREAFYYLGLIEVEYHRYDSALNYLYRCDELCRKLDAEENSGFMAMSNLRIGMIYDVQKKRKHAISQYKKVLKIKKFENSHDSAQKYLKEPFLQ